MQPLWKAFTRQTCHSKANNNIPRKTNKQTKILTASLCVFGTLVLTAPTTGHAEIGDYSGWDSFINAFQPRPANAPMTPADQTKLPIVYVAPRPNFNDGFNPNLYNVWQAVTIDPATGAKCGDGSPYKIWVNRKPTTSNIQLSFAGGGACWDYASCSRDMIKGGMENFFKADGKKDLNAFLSSTPLNASPAMNLMMIAGGTAMLREFDPWMDNKAQKWTKVFLPYCTGDVHIGLGTRIYTDPNGVEEPITVHHNGAINVLQAGAWIRNNLEAPKQIMGNGISAGGIGVVSLYHAIRKLLDAERGYVIDDAGPAWFAQQGGEPDKNPSQFLHKYALQSWGTTKPRLLADGTTRSLIQWYESELPGFDGSNFGTLNTALANRWSQDRFGLMTTQEDYIFSSFSYRKYFPQASVTDNTLRRANTLKLWQTEVNKFASTTQGVPNYGYYFPATRTLLDGHVISMLPDKTADIQELGLTADNFVDSVLDNESPIIQAKEQDFSQDRQQASLLGALSTWIFKMMGL